MPRLHLLELEDQSWFPSLIRDFGTDFLQFTQTVVDQSSAVVPLVERLLQSAPVRRVIDLCSGGSGPWPKLVGQLSDAGIEVPVLLTDRFPNLPAFEHARALSEERIDFVAEPVDASCVPDSLGGVRTLFNGFHHFRPDEARRILQNAVDRNQPIGVFEFVDRTPLAMLGIWLSGLLIVPVLTPFIRPFRWSRLLFTYLIPLVPILVIWDGTVSCLRIYSPGELEALCDQLEENAYDWEAGKLDNPSGPVKITYLVGIPEGP